jgi:hypothetical protein
MSEYTAVPDVLSLLACDQIITDRLTGKQSLIGIFSTIHSWRFPVMHPHLCVYVALTDGRGKTPLTIRIVDADEARPPVVQGTGIVDFKNPRAIANLALQFQGLTLPEPGEYRIQLLSKDVMLRDSRLMLIKVPPPKRPGEPPPEAAG